MSTASHSKRLRDVTKTAPSESPAASSSGTRSPITPDAVKLRDLVRPLPPVELPPVGDATEGRVAAVRVFNFRMRGLAAEIDRLPEGPEQDAKMKELVFLCVPSLTEEEWGELVPEEALAITGVAARRLDDVIVALGNVPAPADVTPRRRRSR